MSEENEDIHVVFTGEKYLREVVVTVVKNMNNNGRPE